MQRVVEGSRYNKIPYQQHGVVFDSAANVLILGWLWKKTTMIYYRFSLMSSYIHMIPIRTSTEGVGQSFHWNQRKENVWSKPNSFVCFVASRAGFHLNTKCRRLGVWFHTHRINEKYVYIRLDMQFNTFVLDKSTETDIFMTNSHKHHWSAWRWPLYVHRVGV